MKTFVLIFVVFSVAIFYLEIRNRMVRSFRFWLIGELYGFKDWQWRSDMYDTVSYKKMLYSFKRLKVTNYYPKDFTI